LSDLGFVLTQVPGALQKMRNNGNGAPECRGWIPLFGGSSPECFRFHSGLPLHPVYYLRAKDNFEIRPTPVDASAIY